MFQWVGQRTQNIGEHVNNDDQRADDHYACGNRRIILLANGINQPTAQPWPAKHHFSDHRQCQHGGELQPEAGNHRRK